MSLRIRKKIFTGVITPTGTPITLNIDENDNISNLSVVSLNTSCALSQPAQANNTIIYLVIL